MTEWVPVVSLFYNGQYNDHSDRVYSAEGIVLGHGQPDEQQHLTPSTCDLGLNDPDRMFFPKNPNSPLHGLIGRNTPIRVDIGTPHPADTNFDLTDTTSQVAPALDAPTNQGLLISAWAAPAASGTYTVPGAMTAGPISSGALGQMASAHQNITAIGDTGTRTATFSAAEDYVAASLLLNGASPSDIESTGGFSVLLVNIDSDEGDWWVVISYFGWNDEEDAMTTNVPRDTDGGGWIVMADSGVQAPGDAEADFFRIKVWIKRVKANSPEDGHVIWVDDLVGSVGATQSVFYRLSAGDNFERRFEGEVSQWIPKWDVSERKQWVEVVASGISRRLSQGDDPLATAPERWAAGIGISAFVRSAAGFWPLDDPQGSKEARAAIGSPMRIVDAPAPLTGKSQPEYAGGEVAPWLGPAMKGTSNAGAIRAPVTQPVGSLWDVGWIYRTDRAGSGDQPIAMGVNVYSDDLVCKTAWGSDDILIGIQILNGAGSVLGSSIITDDTAVRDGQPHHFRFECSEAAGTTTNYFLYVDGELVTSVAVNIGVTTTPRAEAVEIAWNGGTGFGTPSAISSLVIWNKSSTTPEPSLQDDIDVWFGNVERTDDRFQRLCVEQNVPFNLVGGDIDRNPPVAGPQYPDGFMAIVQETAETGGALLTDAREFAGLRYRILQSMYNQPAILELDYSAGQVAPPLDPIVDDQYTRNDVTVSGRGGGQSRVTLDTGPMSTLAPPAGVGRVTASYDVNVTDPVELVDQATWRLHLGTVDEVRYVQITVDLDASPEIAERAARIDAGDRIDILNLPDTINADTVTLLVLGYVETIRQFRRKITFTCVPYQPFQIATVEHNTFSVLQSDAATVNEAVDTTETDIDMLCGGGPDWVYDAGLLLEARSGDYASTPDHSSLDITGDLDLRGDLRMGTWPPAATGTVIAKYNTTGNQRSYQLTIDTAGTLTLGWSNDGTAALSATSTVAVSATTGRLAVRATIDVNNGAAGRTIRFYTAPTIDGTWTQLGADVVQAGVTSIFNSSAVLTVGGRNDGTANLLAARVHAVQVRNGIDGTIVANARFDEQVSGTGSFTDSAGRVWTINATAKMSGRFDLLVGGERMTLRGVSEAIGTFPSRVQTLTVTRSVNGIVKSHSSGAAVQFFYPNYVGL